jgi:hypothetical protein
MGYLVEMHVTGPKAHAALELPLSAISRPSTPPRHVALEAFDRPIEAMNGSRGEAEDRQLRGLLEWFLARWNHLTARETRQLKEDRAPVLPQDKQDRV